MLESLALQVGLIQQSLTPILQHPQNIIFAADHGIVEEGVSLSPKEITWQQISNFLHGGAGVNFLCRQHGFTLKIVDGVDRTRLMKKESSHGAKAHATICTKLQ